MISLRILVEEVVDDEGNVLDIRGVWNAKSDRLNATLWSPGFDLPSTQDRADLTVKWLTVLVGEYLWWGSPLQD